MKADASVYFKGIIQANLEEMTFSPSVSSCSVLAESPQNTEPACFSLATVSASCRSFIQQERELSLDC